LIEAVLGVSAIAEVWSNSWSSFVRKSICWLLDDCGICPQFCFNSWIR